MQPNPPHSTPEALLEHLEWVRRLARGLVADPHAADDLVQEAWMSATRRPPHSGNLRGWLATVVRNAARERARKEARRAVHEERAARSEAQSSSDELAERVAAQQEVVQHVLELAEPYRETVLLRYFQELSPDEIAQRMRVPVATVKTRLRRALAELRERLDRAHGGDGRAWMLALAPLSYDPTTLASASKTAFLLMSTKAIAYSAAALAVAALSVFLWRRDVEQGPMATHLEPQLASHALEARPSPESARGASADEIVAPAADATRVASAQSGRRVHVVDAATRAPVPFAEMWHAAVDWVHWHDPSTDREEYVRSIGTRVVADAAGEVVLAAQDRDHAACARSGDSYGEAVLDFRTDGTGRIELQPDAAIRVQVVDESGAPLAGVQADVWTRAPGADASYARRSNASARTRGADGVARLDKLRVRAAELFEDGAFGLVDLRATLVQRVQREFDPDHLPVEPIRLVSPPTGRVVVLVQDSEGRPVQNVRVYLTPMIQEAAEAGRSVHGPRSDELAREGRAVFEHVALGLELEAVMHPSERPAVEVRAKGPIDVGEEVTITLHAGERHPVLTGVLLDPSRALVANGRLEGHVVIEREGRPAQQDALHGSTDALGRFRIVIATAIEPAVRCKVHVRWTNEDGLALCADLAPPGGLTAEDLDLGEVVLAESSVALAGNVSDALGKPVYWAVVDVARKRGPEQPANSAAYAWIPGQRAMTDREGRFTISGVLPSGEYLVQVRANGYVDSEMRPFAPGTRGWKIVLDQHGALDGSVLLKDGMSTDRIVVDVLPRSVSGDEHARRPRSSRVLPNGRFRVDELAPGLVDVRVRIDGEPEPLTTIDTVTIPSGGETSDARLRPVDLRGFVQRQIEIVIEGPDHRALPSVVVSIRPSGETNAAVRRTLCDDGRLTILSRSSAVDLEVRAPGMRIERRSSVSENQTVVMRPGLPIKIELPDDVELPPAPLELALLLVAESDYRASFEERVHEESGTREHQHYQWLVGQAVPFVQGRERELFVPEAGTDQLRWFVMSRAIDDAVQVAVNSSHDAPTLRVSESDAGITFQVAPGASELTEALEEARRR